MTEFIFVTNIFEYSNIYLSHSDVAPAVEEAVRITSKDHLKQEIIDRM